MLTDDPDTPGPSFWEINLAGIAKRTQAERRYEAPTVDINYGVGERIQLKFEIPWVNSSGPGHSFQTAAGNSNSGVKWRFMGQEGLKIAWSIYPQLELNTADAALRKGIVDEGPRFLLPTELTLGFGRFEINGEVGRIRQERKQRLGGRPFGRIRIQPGLRSHVGIAWRQERL